MREYKVTIGDGDFTISRRDDGVFVMPAALRALAGYGTALKPSHEPVVWAMKPLDGTFCENALKWGVAGLNVAGGRIGTSKDVPASPAKARENVAKGRERDRTGENSGADPAIGRWPANVILCHHSECREVGVRRVKGDQREGQQRGFRPGGFGDVGADGGSPLPAGPLYGDTEIPIWDCHQDCAVAELDRQSGETSVTGNRSGASAAAIVAGTNWGTANHRSTEYPGDSGTASQFFYQAKVSPSERNGSKHPTLKPIDLCRYLAKLILPPPRRDEPRRLLVPFAGEGSEIIGALAAGWEEVTGIEREEEYIVNAAKRIRNTAPLIYQVDLCPTEANP